MKQRANFIKALAQGERPTMRQVNGAVHARLLAQEYVRNGLNLPQAYVTIHPACSFASAKNNTTKILMRGHFDDFVDEMGILLRKADIDRDAVLASLWTMVQTSILDFFDDNGQVLPVSALKKLPRCLQTVIQKMEVTTKQKVIEDGQGNPMVDANGRPFLRADTFVKIEMPSKLDAIRQIAQILKLIGPETVINNYNIGDVMVGADDRRRRMERVYEGSAAVTLRTDTDSAIEQEHDAGGNR